MTFLILTHNYYAITSLVTLTLGSFFIANHIYERWLGEFNFQLVDANLVTKFFIVVLGSTIVSWKSLLNASLEIQFISGCIGVVIGYACLALEAYLISLLCDPWSSSSSPNRSNTKATNNIFNKIKKKPITTYQPSYFSIILVGSLEEIIYRGFLTALCIALLSPGESICALVLITIIFALNHLNLGNIHILTKFILGMTCLLSFLISKTLITPIFIHATFNALVINKYRKLAYV
jgi:membrane protease YdiL (CAAX protease family)